MPANSNASIEHGILVRQWKWPLRMLFWWVTIGTCAWAATLAVHWYWSHDRAPEAQLAYAQDVLQRELGELAQFDPVVFDPIALATRITTGVHDIAVDTALLCARALMNWTSWMRSNAASAEIRSNPDPGGDFVRRQLKEAGDGWMLMVTNTGLFAVRTATYLCALPLLAMGMLLGITDGLVARAKRKACAGHESASIYHRAKLAISFVAILGYVVYLGLPRVAQPLLILLPLAGLLAVLVRTQSKFYKKYL